jgi:tyrosine aminotransferase
VWNILKGVNGLKPIMPRGGMYFCIVLDLHKFPKIDTCLQFSQQLLKEQNVATFPGNPCFNFPGFIRLVLTVPSELIIEACERIKEFCEVHFKFESEKCLKSG